VLYLERREGTQQETDHLLFELVARYVSIVVFNGAKSLIHDALRNLFKRIFLPLKSFLVLLSLRSDQRDAYSYNNSAFTDLYKVQGEDQTLEGYCRQLERSNTNKTVDLSQAPVPGSNGSATSSSYTRDNSRSEKRSARRNRVNQKVFAASLVRPQTQENEEALQREENTLKEIPQRHFLSGTGSIFQPMRSLIINRNAHQADCQQLIY